MTTHSPQTQTEQPEPLERYGLIDFPTDFSLKVMGEQNPDFVQEILKAIQTFAPDTSERNVVLRPSTKGNFVGATVTVRAENQEQLDNIYRAVTSHPLVKVVF